MRRRARPPKVVPLISGGVEGCDSANKRVRSGYPTLNPSADLSSQAPNPDPLTKNLNISALLTAKTGSTKMGEHKAKV
jgi:hypothetical protein